MSSIPPEAVSIAGASCRLWRDAPTWADRRTAAVGAFACDSAEAGSALLRNVADRLRGEGFEAVIGPMDGDTWHKYRVVSESDGSAPYFLEPVSGAHDLAAFRNAGFQPISSYVSARTSLDEAIGAPAAAVDGITITAWDGRDAGSLIGGLFDLSRHAFTGNAFYKPITREAFLELYQPILPAIDPRLVFFAHGPRHELAGFLFAIPDRNQGPKPTTGIIKTYASGVRGVGHMLLDRAHRSMRDFGMTEVVHALMHVDNQSRQRSARHQGRVFRRYDLMGLQLGAGAA